MSDGLALAVSGSNVSGDSPFSCALAVGGRIEVAASPAGARGDLAALVADLCSRHAVRPDQVADVRIDLGPGSYTGLRVAVTFVRFLLQFGQARVRAVDSLSLLATAGLRVARGRSIRPLLDARRERVHHAVLRHHEGSRLVVAEAARALPFADVAASAGAGDLFVLPADAAAAFGPALTAQGSEVFVARGVTASDLFSPALECVECRLEELEPRYLMASYAE